MFTIKFWFILYSILLVNSISSAHFCKVLLGKKNSEIVTEKKNQSLLESERYAKNKFNEIKEMVLKYGLSLLMSNSWVGDLNKTELRSGIYSDLPVYSENKITSHMTLGTVVLNWGVNLNHVQQNDLRSPLHLGRIDLPIYKKIDSHKVGEWSFVHKIDPDIMPRSIQANEIVDVSKNNTMEDAFNNSLFNGGQGVGEIFQSYLDFMNLRTLAKFPNGAIFKLDVEQQTGDSNGLLTTQNLKKITFNEIEIKQYIEKNDIKDMHDFIDKITKDNEASRSLKLICWLLKSPHEVLVQELVTIEKYVGRNIEIRVDFLNGTALMASTRYGFAYLPEVNAKALSYINHFLFKVHSLYPEYGSLSGAADVVLLSDGTLKVMEWNFGNKSGFILPRFQPVEANWLITILQGRSTNLIQELNQIYEKPLQTQIQFIQKFSRKKYYKVDSQSQIYIAEIIAFLRDIAFEVWIENSKQVDEFYKIINYVRALTDSIKNADSDLKKDLDEIVMATESYLERFENNKTKNFEGHFGNKMNLLPLKNEKSYDQFRAAYNEGVFTEENRYVSIMHENERVIGRVNKIESDGSLQLSYIPANSNKLEIITLNGGALLQIRISATSKSFFW